MLNESEADSVPVEAVNITLAPNNDNDVVPYTDVTDDDKIAVPVGMIEAVTADKTTAPGVDKTIELPSSVNAPAALNVCVVPEM